MAGERSIFSRKFSLPIFQPFRQADQAHQFGPVPANGPAVISIA
jgi:hypothetical protein